MRGAVLAGALQGLYRSMGQDSELYDEKSQVCQELSPAPFW